MARFDPIPIPNWFLELESDNYFFTGGKSWTPLHKTDFFTLKNLLVIASEFSLA